MSDQDGKSAKERILEAAIRLFAQKSYSATGLREIVREAGVSIAMVNYHFGSKQALLKEIMDVFFTHVFSIAEQHFQDNQAVELRVRRFIRSTIKLFREHPDLLRIMLTELPRDIPDIVDFKAERKKRLVGLVRDKLLPDLPNDMGGRIRLEIVGPALVGMMTLHFLVRPVVERVFGTQFDDAFYQGYADELADLFLYGLVGLQGNLTQNRKDS